MSLLGLVGLPAVVGTAAPAHGTDACSHAAFDGTRTLGGRTYLLHVPAALPEGPVPLVVTLHGTSSNAATIATQTGWREMGDAHGFITAFPNGTNRTWNFTQQGEADAAFVRAVVADIAAGWCVDPARVHLSGHSAGAFMSERLACDSADVFASAAVYAGGPPDASNYPCAPSRPIGVALFHGELDTVVLKALGELARDGWVSRLGCAPSPIRELRTDGTALRYVGCDGDVVVTWRTYNSQNHAWPKGVRGLDMRNRMWAHMQAHPRP